MEKISAVLIVKNEQKVIERCLRSVKDCDEIVVLDTGSSDRTMELAREMGAKVESVPEEKPFHFAKARNAAARLATNDWILAIDADEVLRTGMLGKIRRAIRDQEEKDPLDRVNAFIITFTDKDAVTRKKKIYRKDIWNWKWRCHEQLHPFGTDAREAMLESVIMDHLPLANKTQRRGQNVELLKITILESPEYTRAWKHLGQELMLDKAYKDAIPYLEHFVEKTDEGPLEKSEVMMRLGQCNGELLQIEEACQWFNQAAQIDPRRREPLYHGGWYVIKNARTVGDMMKAVNFLERCISIPPSSKPGSHCDQPKVWTREPERMLSFCKDQIAKASP